MDLTLDLQLSVMTRAMRDVVLPALPHSDSKAVEQASLVLAFLEMIREHAPLAARYEQAELRQYLELGRQLLPLLPADDALAQNVRAAIDRAASANAAGPEGDDAPAAIARLRAAIGELAASPLSHDGSAPSPVGRLILAAARRETTRERTWLVRTGFEPDPTVLPNVEFQL